ncbi:MAG: polysaccharide biosynthesis/export family protein, partial [Terriglobia bacterium]
ARKRFGINKERIEGEVLLRIRIEDPVAAPRRAGAQEGGGQIPGLGMTFGLMQRKNVVNVGLVLLAAIAAVRPMLCQEAFGSQDSDAQSVVISANLPIRPVRPGEELIIKPDDLLRIDVFDVPQLSGMFRVSPAGTIALPLISAPVYAAGSTPEELSQRVAEKLKTSGLVSEPRVTVVVEPSRLHSVVIGGAVKKPQIYPLFGRMTLLDALAQAEGLSADAGDTAIITRGENAEQCEPGGRPEAACTAPPHTGLLVPGAPGAAKMVVNLKRLMETNGVTPDVYLYPGDSVTVQRAGIIYVVGAVNHPGGFALTGGREPMTVLKAISLAADLKPTAARNRAIIMRPDPSNPKERRKIEVNLDRIFAGRTPDPPLQASDILFVPDSASQKTLRRAAEAAVEVATGVAIFRQ